MAKGGGEGSPRQEPPSRSTQSLRKWLVLCWILAIGYIWISPDDNDEHEDPTFREPPREVRPLQNNDPFQINFDDRGGEMKGAEGDSDSGEINMNSMRNIVISNTSTATAKASGEAKEKITIEIVSEQATNTSLDNIKTQQPDVLVEALQPITFNKCCIPKVYQETKNPQDVDCFGTCYNERACTDPIFPFNSAEEKAMFPLSNVTPELKRKLQRVCKAPKSMTPPVEWCQEPHPGIGENETAAELVEGIPPAGCSQVTNGGGSGAFQHAIIFPSAKLAFCGIPKVGITQWEQFLRFYLGAKDYPALPHYKLDRDFFQFDALEPYVQRRIWEDEEWTWAAFIRNPAERLLSAFLDKVKSKKDKLKWIQGNLTFEKFVDSVSEPVNFTNCGQTNPLSSLSWCSDPHWRPQVYSCGLSERLDRFQFIGDLHNAADHTLELLQHVGLWESHGKHFVHGGEKYPGARNPWCNVVPKPLNETSHIGFQQKDKVGNSSEAEVAYGHAKGSKDKMEKFFSPELLKKVEEELYPHDHKLWKLVSANGNKLSKGKELLPQLSSQCSK